MILFLWTLTALFARLIERSWWSPGALLALSMWVSAFGTITMAPEYYMSLQANIYLVIMTLLVSFGTVFGTMLGEGASVDAFDVHLVRPKFLFYFGLFFSLFSFAVTLKVIGVRLPDLASPIGIMRAAQAATYERYTTGLRFPITYNISNALFLAYAMAVSLYFVDQRKIVIRYLIPVAIFIAANMLITTRAPILFMILLMIFPVVYALYLRSGDNRLPDMFTPQVLKYAVLGILSVAVMFFLFQVLRFGEESSRSASEVWLHLRRWPWGSLPGFSLWFDDPSGDIWYRVPGSYTWMGIFDQLGIEKRVVGGYGEYHNLTSSEAANIFTVFRGLYLDFGWIGSGVFMFVLGVLGGLSLKALRRIGPFFAMSAYVAIMGFMAFAFVVSFWAFTANIVALLVFPILVICCFSSAPDAMSVKSGEGVV